MCKTNYPELEAKVKKLESETNEENQEKILQEINGLLISDFAIKINENIVIKPLLIEAYYYNEEQFKDENTYQEPGQSNRFGKLFFHPENKEYSLGVDVCLSMCDNYYLSFLIKNSVVVKKSDKQFYSQEALYEYIKKHADINVLSSKENLLIEDHHNYEIIHTVRRGLKKPFKDKQLASLPINEIKNYNFSLERGFSREKLLAEYLKKYKAEHPLTSLSELDEMRRNLFPTGGSTEFKRVFGELK